MPEPLERAQHLTEEAARRLLHALEESRPPRRLPSSQVATAFDGSIGFVLFIFGVERAAEDLPPVSNPYGSITVGLVLLAATGLLLTRLAGRE
jgi:hypothetical protein